MKTKVIQLLSVAAALALGLQVLPARAEEEGESPVRTITLEEAILLARTESVESAVALNELKSAYWQYRSFLAELLPEVSFTATVPSLGRQYNAMQTDDGLYKFVRSDHLEMSGALSVDQNIWFTGGKLSLETSLDYLRDLSGATNDQYMSVPVTLTLQQPIFGVNDTKWKRRIEPEKYKEAKASFISATEEVTITTIQYYFNLLLAKENVEIYRQNLDNALKLYEIAKAKRELGQISQNDLLQMELNVLNARSSLTDYESSLKSNMFTLRNFIGIEEEVELDPVVPENVPDMYLDYEDVLSKALENNSFSHSMVRQKLEADYAVATAKGNLREITLYAKVGYSGADTALRSSYANLVSNQAVQVGLSIPILDWGKRRGRLKVAESDRDLAESRLRREEMEFRQEIYILVGQFNRQAEQLDIARQADKISESRYKTNVETFMVGKISTLDLNDSQTAKDTARRDYINELYSWWLYWYQVRDLTLWDYEGGRLIDADIDKIVDR